MISVALVGCGSWGRNLARNLVDLGALSAICDSNLSRAASVAAEHGVPARAFTDVLVDPAIDAVVVATPAALHHLVAREALIAGKHTFVEKPLALDARDAEELCQLADQHQCVLMVGHLLQYHPAFECLKKLVANGTIGQLQYIYSNRLNLGKVRQEENALWSFAPHDISMILSLMGDEPINVTACGGAFLNETIADVTTTHMAFAGGKRAHVFVSWLHPFKEQRLVVVGSNGMAVFNDAEPWERKILHYPYEVIWKDGVPLPGQTKPQLVPVAEEEPLRIECQHFLDCVETGATPKTDGREGLRVLRVLRKAQQALDQGVGEIHE